MAARSIGYTVNGTTHATHVPLPPQGAGITIDEVPTRSPVRRLSSTFWLVAGLWMIPVLVSTTQTYLFLQHEDQPRFSYWTALVWQGVPWLFWALMTPIVIRLAQRYPMERGVWVRNVGVHVLANALMGPLHIIVCAVMGLVVRPEWYNSCPFIEVVYKLFGKHIHLELIIYWGMLGLSYAFAYHRKYREEALIAAKLETKLVQAELSALKMQLHPHFIFNTLHAIAVLVRKQDTQASVRMITGLSDLLRMALDSSGKQIVPLKQELDFLNRYLDIEKTRFRDRLTVHTEIAPETLDAEIPNLILQPIVENAIRHGIAPRASSGHIELCARRRDGRLVVEVRDDGRGLRDGWDPETCGGMGLSNLRARLRQLYPARHRLSVAPREGGGVIVTVEVPFRSAHATSTPEPTGRRSATSHPMAEGFDG